MLAPAEMKVWIEKVKVARRLAIAANDTDALSVNPYFAVRIIVPEWDVPRLQRVGNDTPMPDLSMRRNVTYQEGENTPIFMAHVEQQPLGRAEPLPVHRYVR